MCTELRLPLVPNTPHSEMHVQWTFLPAMTGHSPSKRKIFKFLSEHSSGLSHSNYLKRLIVNYIEWHKECSCWRGNHRKTISFLLCKALRTGCGIARKFRADNSSPPPLWGRYLKERKCVQWVKQLRLAAAHRSLFPLQKSRLSLGYTEPPTGL